jgi:hypothetical protein
MRYNLYLIWLLFLFFFSTHAQLSAFKQNNKFGIKANAQNISAAYYDTIVGFDKNNAICLACIKTKTASANKFLKMLVTTYQCNYINEQGKKLIIKTHLADTTSTFGLSKNALTELTNFGDYFVATYKNNKYLLAKNFNQLTFKEYTGIALSNHPNYLFIEEKTESGSTVLGIINKQEEVIVKPGYSNIKINTFDSLIIACSAGTSINGDDDVYNYLGKKMITFKRHIDMATKNYIVHKIFTPNTYYIILNLNTNEEKTLNAEEVKLYSSNHLLIRTNNDWFIYNLISNQKSKYLLNKNITNEKN